MTLKNWLEEACHADGLIKKSTGHILKFWFEWGTAGITVLIPVAICSYIGSTFLGFDFHFGLQPPTTSITILVLSITTTVTGIMWCFTLSN